MNDDKFSYFVGLDIGTSAVRCVVGELSGDDSLPTVIGFSSVPNSGMRKGNVSHIDEICMAVSSAISEAERMSGRDIKAATVNVNGSHVEGLNSQGVIAISSPNRQITDEDRLRVEEAAATIALPPNKDIIQVFAKNYRLDGAENIKDPVGMHGVRLEVDTHILTASTPALRGLDQVLDKAEVKPSHRTVTSLAAAEATLSRNQKDSGVAVVDIGAATTNLVIIEDGEIEHIAVVPLGGNHLTNDLAIGLKTDLDIAEIVKVKHASLEPAASGQVRLSKDGHEHKFDKETIRIVVEARIEEIFEFVDKEFKAAHRSRKLPGGVVLVGGTSKLPGIVESAKHCLELPARLGTTGHIERVVDGLDELIFAPAVGLMLLDMYLGPAQNASYVDSLGGITQSVNSSLNNFFSRLRRR
ncbi:MAG: cell division protein FtsA [Candidatus Saccharimonadales bacterium]